MGRRERSVVTFDDRDRKRFLTGFHKRKVARREAAESQREAASRAHRAELRRKNASSNNKKNIISTTTWTHAPELGKSTNPNNNTAIYEDDNFSKRAFGADSAVVVTTVTGLDSGHLYEIPDEKEAGESLDTTTAHTDSIEAILQEVTRFAPSSSTSETSTTIPRSLHQQKKRPKHNSRPPKTKRRFQAPSR